MSKVIRASVLVLLLTCSASAGIMTHGVKEPPPIQSVEETTTAAETETPLLVQIVLNLLILL